MTPTAANLANSRWGQTPAPEDPFAWVGRLKIIYVWNIWPSPETTPPGRSEEDRADALSPLCDRD